MWCSGYHACRVRKRPGFNFQRVHFSDFIFQVKVYGPFGSNINYLKRFVHSLLALLCLYITLQWYNTPVSQVCPYSSIRKLGHRLGVSAKQWRKFGEGFDPSTVASGKNCFLEYSPLNNHKPRECRELVSHMKSVTRITFIAMCLTS